jgi:hypothetical protein
MSAAPAPDRERLARVIADRHSIRVEKDDPLFAVGTICEEYINEAGRQFDELVKNRLAEFETAAGRIEKRVGQLIAQEFNDHLAAVRNSLQTDITMAGAKANEIVYRIEQAYRYPVFVTWTVVGLLTSFAFLCVGVWIGMTYGHR